MMKMVRTMMMIALTVALFSWTAAAQQVSTGTIPASMPGQTAMQTFSLGGDTSYTIGPISKIDAWRASEMGIPWVSLPAGATAYIAYSTGMPLAPGSSTDMARMIVFGPGGFVSAGSWPGTGGSTQTFKFTGSAGQDYMVSQLSGGTQDRVIVSFG